MNPFLRRYRYIISSNSGDYIFEYCGSMKGLYRDVCNSMSNFKNKQFNSVSVKDMQTNFCIDIEPVSEFTFYNLINMQNWY